MQGAVNCSPACGHIFERSMAALNFDMKRNGHLPHSNNVEVCASFSILTDSCPFSAKTNTLIDSCKSEQPQYISSALIDTEDQMFSNHKA
jgi:hypothetical protein